MAKFHSETRKKEEAGPASRYSGQILTDGFSLDEAYGLGYFVQLFVNMLLKRFPYPRVLACGADPAYIERDITDMGCGFEGFDPIIDNVAFAQRKWAAKKIRYWDPLKKELPYDDNAFNGIWMHNALMELYWAPQLELALERIARTAAPGTLVFATYKEEPKDLPAYLKEMRLAGFDFTLTPAGHIDLTMDKAMKGSKRHSGMTIDDRRGWRSFHWWNDDEPQPDDIFFDEGFEIAEFEIGGISRKVAGHYLSGRNWHTGFRVYRKVA
jgi:hypothetical protein